MCIFVADKQQDVDVPTVCIEHVDGVTEHCRTPSTSPSYDRSPSPSPLYIVRRSACPSPCPSPSSSASGPALLLNLSPATGPALLSNLSSASGPAFFGDSSSSAAYSPAARAISPLAASVPTSTQQPAVDSAYSSSSAARRQRPPARLVTSAAGQVGGATKKVQNGGGVNNVGVVQAATDYELPRFGVVSNDDNELNNVCSRLDILII